jgi:hypothetical protein
VGGYLFNGRRVGGYLFNGRRVGGYLFYVKIFILCKDIYLVDHDISCKGGL